VKTSHSVKIFVPIGLCRTVNGSEVIFTVFQKTDMSEEKFAEDVELVEEDLKNLESIMEGN
jgi:hypothetical protein